MKVFVVYEETIQEVVFVGEDMVTVFNYIKDYDYENFKCDVDYTINTEPLIGVELPMCCEEAYEIQVIGIKSDTLYAKYIVKLMEIGKQDYHE